MNDVGIAIGVHYGNYRQLQLVGLGHRDVLLFCVEHKNRIGRSSQVANAVQVALKLRQFPGDEQGLLFGHHVELARTAHPLEFFHLAHALGDRLEVGQETSQPTLVHIGHSHPLGVTLHAVLGLLLGSHKQHLAALGHQIANIGVGRFDMGERLGQIDDVNTVALAENKPLHFRIPTAGLVSEVDSSIEQLTHRHDWRHGVSPLPAVHRDPGSAPIGDRGMPRVEFVYGRKLLSDRDQR